MAGRLSVRFLLEAGFGGGAAALGVLTLFWRDWIEAIFGIDPDHHNGSFEWLIVAGSVHYRGIPVRSRSGRSAPYRCHPIEGY